MIQNDRHVPLRPLPWDEGVVASAIDEIVSDALAHFRPEGFWPSHPLDGRKDDGHSSLYMGAAGMIWGLDYLQRVGATKAAVDFRPEPADVDAAIARCLAAVRSGRSAVLHAKVTKI